MMRPRINLAIVLTAAVAAAACSKTGSAPTGFGVNVTVDATMVPMAQRAKITSDKLTVVSDKAGSSPITHALDDLPKAIQGGTVRFHYTPATDITASNKLTLGLDVMDASNKLIASGSAPPVMLAANAVEVTITLTASEAGDAGMTNGDANQDTNAGEVVNPNGKANGVACVTDDDCGTGFCTDGVCCNERCNDVCVSCNQTGSKGTCTPYVVNTDPEMECLAKIPTAPSDDGGAAPDASAEAGSEAGTEAGSEAGSAADGADADDGGAATDADMTFINTPDGGFMTMPKACGGTCGGARACKYPGTETTCGTPFCNTSDQQAAFMCDGTGVCGPVLTQCQDYSCNDATGACGSAAKGCSKASDCLDSDYCTGDGKCMPKKGDSIPCSLPSECANGNCSGDGTATSQKVCCNTACDGMGLTCIEAGHVGQCQCLGVTCAAGVSCQVFYVDADHDTFGDASGTIANGGAKAGCMGSPPAGFVADNTDCDDANSNAFKNQPMYFGTPRANGTYDYDCSGGDDQQTPVYVNGVCRFCGGTAACATTTTSCTGTTVTGSFQCPLESNGVFREPLAASSLESSVADVPGLTSRGGIGVTPEPVRPVFGECCGCMAADKAGFVAAVKCGAYAYKHTCGACNGSAESADVLAYTQQLCH